MAVIPEAQQLRFFCILFSIVGNIFGAFGQNLQRSVHYSIGSVPPGKKSRPNFLRHGAWWAGLILIIVGEAGNFIAYAFSPVTLIVPLGIFGVLVNAMLSHRWLAEPYDKTETIGLGMLSVGSIIMLLTAPHESRGMMGELFSEFTFSPMFFIFIFGSLGAYIAMCHMVDAETKQNNLLVWLTMSSLMGAITVMFAKGLSFALFATIMGGNLFHWPTSWLCFIIGTVTSILQFVCTAKARRYSPSCVFVPIHYILFSMFTIFTSIVLLREVLSPWTIYGFIMYCIAAVGAVFPFLLVRSIIATKMIAHPGHNDNYSLLHSDSEGL